MEILLQSTGDPGSDRKMGQKMGPGNGSLMEIIAEEAFTMTGV
jgi:hypothetical protein